MKIGIINMKKFYALLFLFCSQMATAFPTVTEINPTVDSLMKLVNMDSLEAKIRYLQNLGVRAADCPVSVDAQNYLYQKYQNYNLILELQRITLTDSNLLHNFMNRRRCDSTIYEQGDTAFPSANVIATQRGTTYPDEYIIVCGHYDHNDGPGADDNASGTAGTAEIARILSKHKFKRSIIYINFTAEENGLWGSLVYAARCKNEGKNILGVFNLDMIGYSFPMYDWDNWIPSESEHPDFLGFEPLRIFYNDRPPINQAFAKHFAEVANLYLPDIPAVPYRPSSWGGGRWGVGDDLSFILYDYPAMYMGDILSGNGSRNPPCYHRPCDTIGIGKVDAGVNSMELVQGYTRATLAAIAELAELDVSSANSISCVISPNPTNATTTITLYFNDVGNLTITLNNVLGQEVMKVYDGFADTRIFAKKLSLSHLPKGVYYLKITHNENIKVEKIVVN